MHRRAAPRRAHRDDRDARPHRAPSAERRAQPRQRPCGDAQPHVPVARGLQAARDRLQPNGAPGAAAGLERAGDEHLAARAGRRPSWPRRAGRAPRSSAAASRSAPARRRAAAAMPRRVRSRCPRGAPVRSAATRLLFVSATYTSPSQPTASAVGWENWPGRGAAAAPAAQPAPADVEYLDAVVVRVDDVEVPGASKPIPSGEWKLPSSPPGCAPSAEHGARRGELHDAVVAGVGDVDVAVGLDGDAFRAVERPRRASRRAAASARAPAGEQRAFGPEHEDAVVPGVGDEGLVGRRGRQRRRRCR